MIPKGYQPHLSSAMSTTEPNNGKIKIALPISGGVVYAENDSKKKTATSTAAREEKKKTLLAKHKILLPSDFTPGEYDVICSRGKDARNHKGNRFFQSVIQKIAPKYATSEGKLGKSIIVSQIVDTIRKRSNTRGFVKLIGGQWYELGDLSARERVSQSFRDLLHVQYRSSAISKRTRKNEMNFKMMKDLEGLVDSNQFISNRTEAMKKTFENYGDTLDDSNLLLMMTKMNREILNQLKIDPELQQRFGQMHTDSSLQPRPIAPNKDLQSQANARP